MKHLDNNIDYNDKVWVESLISNLPTLPDKAKTCLWEIPSSCTLTTTTAARDPSRPTPGRYGATLATRRK